MVVLIFLFRFEAEYYSFHLVSAMSLSSMDRVFFWIFCANTVPLKEVKFIRHMEEVQATQQYYSKYETTLRRHVKNRHTAHCFGSDIIEHVIAVVVGFKDLKRNDLTCPHRKKPCLGY